MRKIIDLLAALGIAWSLLAPSPVLAQQPVVPYSTNPLGGHRVVQWNPVLLTSLGSTVTSVVSNQSANLAFIYCYNPTGAAAYLQLFDVATAGGVTLGTTTPKLSLGIPTAQASGLGPATIGVQFKTGIQAASTTTPTGSSAAVQHCNVAYN